MEDSWIDMNHSNINEILYDYMQKLNEMVSDSQQNEESDAESLV